MSERFCPARRALPFVLLCLAAFGRARAADATKPAEVTGLRAERSGSGVHLAWDAVTLDAAGGPETIDHYNVYRGTGPDFTPDLAGGSNRLGSSPLPTFDDSGGLEGPSYFYLLTAVDASGNESAVKPSKVATPPTLSGTWTDTSIDLQWSGAQPVDQIQGYRVYCGTRSRVYELAFDAGTASSISLGGLAPLVNWYCAVTAVDLGGNESAFSNEHVDAVAGRVKVRAHDDDYLCWLSGGQQCPPRPGTVQRSDGFQLMVPVDFPEGDWTSVNVTYTLDSRLCSPPAHGTTDKCGASNPTGWNPCGDPWDRIATLFLVLDDCIETGGSCITRDNLELMRAITPFGTDAPPPDGTGVVPPRALTLDITPFARLLQGRRYVGAEIGNYVHAGWHVTVDFSFSKRPEEASSRPPAAGVQVLGFGGAPLPTRSVTIPAGAIAVRMRVFTTGHGGDFYCNGGTNNGAVCGLDEDCPGGTCDPCDEFCRRTNRILRDGTQVWAVVPWKIDCSSSANPCYNWNACGYPSCTYPRAGWCPGMIACYKSAPCNNDFSMTAQFPPGGTYNVDYEVLVQRGYWLVSVVFYWY